MAGNTDCRRYVNANNGIGESMAMREQLAILVRLQAIDSEIQDIEKRLGKVDGEMAVLDLELEKSESEITEKVSIREEYQKKYRSLESDANVNLPKIAKSKEKLTSVKTNKEYQALLKEIDDLKNANSRIEDQMLEILEQSENAEAQLSEKQQAFASAKNRVIGEKKGIAKAAEEDRSRLAGLQADFQTVLDTVNPDILKAFMSVRSRIGKMAIAEVVDAVCAGCHMNIPPQMYNDLQRFESLMYCPQCQRIIYSSKL
jgi:predicted  nucleic acid-binding Zn-ribbon protein